MKLTIPAREVLETVGNILRGEYKENQITEEKINHEVKCKQLDANTLNLTRIIY